MTEKYRSIVVNPKEKTITIMDIEPSFDVYKSIIGCDIIEHYSLHELAGISIWMDENARLYSMKDQHPVYLWGMEFINTVIITGKNIDDCVHGVQDCNMNVDDFLHYVENPTGEWELRGNYA